MHDPDKPIRTHQLPQQRLDTPFDRLNYPNGAAARTEAGRFGRERIQRGRQAQLALPLRPDKLWYRGRIAV
jgi:hypothetical protein